MMNVVPWLIETDDELPSASIKSVRETEHNIKALTFVQAFNERLEESFKLPCFSFLQPQLSILSDAC